MLQSINPNSRGKLSTPVRPVQFDLEYLMAMDQHPNPKSEDTRRKDRDLAKTALACSDE
jgi:hypothetical protein